MSESVNGVVVVHITEELFLSFPPLEWKLDSSKYAFTLFLCFYFIGSNCTMTQMELISI